MPTSTFSATEVKYASGSSWTSGWAKQGVYSDTRFEGALRFPDLANLPYGNIAISQIKLTCTFGSSGGSSNKYLTLYEGAKATITGSISSMRGASIGAVVVQDAYSATRTVTFSSSTNAAMFANMTDFFSGGGIVLILYVPTTRGTFSGGYCYDYLSVTAASLAITHTYLKSDGALSPPSVDAGAVSTLDITAYNSAYKHSVKWDFGSHTHTESVAAGATSASYTIDPNWLDAIPAAISGAGTVTLETFDANDVSLGSNQYPITITVPASVVPSISSISATPSNDNSKLAGWGIFAQGKSKANLAIVGAAGKYGSTIKSYSITTSPSIGAATAVSTQTALIYQTGTITITGTVTDTRERTATKTATISVYPYAAPSFTPVDVHRCTSAGVRDDINGTYARIKATFGCSALSGSNAAAGTVTISQIGGSYTATTPIVSGVGYTLGGGSIAVDATFAVEFAITDTVGSATPYNAEINSAAYIIHIKKGGKAVGFGMAAGADGTASFGWSVSAPSLELDTPLPMASGGLEATTAAGMRAKLGVQFQTYYSVAQLGLVVGSATINAAFAAMPSHSVIVCQVSEWASDQVPSSTYGVVEIAKCAVAARSFCYYHGKTSADGTFRQYLVSDGNSFDGTWRRVYDGAAAVPVSGGGTNATVPKDALTNLGIFYAATLPASGTDGQICLVPVS